MAAPRGWARLPHSLICTRRLTMPAATFGCWFGGVLSPCGGAIACRRPIKISSGGSQKCADSLPESSTNSAFQVPPGISYKRSVRRARICKSSGPCQPSSSWLRRAPWWWT